MCTLSCQTKHVRYLLSYILEPANEFAVCTKFIERLLVW